MTKEHQTKSDLIELQAVFYNYKKFTALQYPQEGIFYSFELRNLKYFNLW